VLFNVHHYLVNEALPMTTWHDFSTNLEFGAIRIGSVLLLSFIDDPAWLAFMFC
jgi:hypothetical protein